MKRRCWFCLLTICGMFAIISAYQCLTIPFEGDEKIQLIDQAGFESNGCLYYSVFSLVSSAWEKYPYDYRNRLLSWWLGLAAIPLLFWVGRSIKDSFTGLLVAFLLASNVSHLAAASFHRFYTANEFCTILATGLCLWACRGQRWSRWCWYLMAMLASVESMLLSLLLLLIHLFIVLLTSTQRSVALKRFGLVALICSLVWGFLVCRDPTGLKRIQYVDFDRWSLVTFSDVLFSYGENHRCCVSDSMNMINFAEPVKRAGNGSLLIVRWLTMLAVIGVWRWSRSAAWKKLTRVKLALLLGMACITILVLAFSYSVKNLIKPTNLLWLIPYVVLLLGLAMRTSRVFRIVMLTAVLLATPYLSLTTMIAGGFNNVYYRYAFSRWRQGELIVAEHMPTVSLPTVLSSVLNVPHFRQNAPGVLVKTDRTNMVRFLLWSDTSPWKRIWLLTSRRQELEQCIGKGHPVKIGNHTVRYIRFNPVVMLESRLFLYYIIIEPSDVSEGKK